MSQTASAAKAGPKSDTSTPASPPETDTSAASDGGAAESLRHRWLETQAHLLDDPRESVSRADALIQDALQHLEASAAAARTRINDYWSADGKLSTDELRVALREYRRLFQHVIGAGEEVPAPELAGQEQAATTTATSGAAESDPRSGSAAGSADARRGSAVPSGTRGA